MHHITGFSLVTLDPGNRIGDKGYIGGIIHSSHF